MVSILSVIMLLRVYSKYQRILYSSDQAFWRQMSETRIADLVRLIPHLKKSPKNQRPNKALYFPKGNQIVKMHYYDYLGL